MSMKSSSTRKSSAAASARKARAGAAAQPVRRSTAARGGALDTGAPEDIRDAVSRLKRERIIATAVELFYSQGLSNTTLEAVADRMNVTKPFIYSHFKSKSELLAEICSRGIRASLDALNRVVASQGTATEKLQALAREFMLAVLANQAHIAIYNREEKHLLPEASAAINVMRREFDRKFCALLEEGVESAEFVVDDVQICSLAIGGIVSWSYVWYRPNGRLTQEQTADRVADLVLAMVNAKPARRKRARSLDVSNAAA
jgi:TetR/AcrR family transcriptional regulator, cholesterol catabolism regulator